MQSMVPGTMQNLFKEANEQVYP